MFILQGLKGCLSKRCALTPSSFPPMKTGHHIHRNLGAKTCAPRNQKTDPQPAKLTIWRISSLSVASAPNVLAGRLYIYTCGVLPQTTYLAESYLARRTARVPLATITFHPLIRGGGHRAKYPGEWKQRCCELQRELRKLSHKCVCVCESAFYVTWRPGGIRVSISRIEGIFREQMQEILGCELCERVYNGEVNFVFLRV